MYFDTGGSFDIQRLQDLMEARKVEGSVSFIFFIFHCKPLGKSESIVHFE